QPCYHFSLPGAGELGGSERWLVFRARLPSGKEQLRALSFTDPATVRAISHARARGRLGRPSLGHNTVVYHMVNPGGSELFSLDLLSGKRRVLRSSRRDLLLNPARVGSRLLYERVGRCGQELRLRPRPRRRALCGSGWRLCPVRGGTPGRTLSRLPPLAGQDAGHENGHTTQGERLPC